MCDSGECTNKVTSRGVEALDEWCKESCERSGRRVCSIRCEWLGVPLGRWVVFMGTKRGECMGNGMVVEVLGNMLGPLSKCGFNGFA